MSTHQSPNTNILWFLPTHGDGRYLGTTTGGREVNFNYLRQIAQAADQLGYFGVLLPTGRSCEDSWVVASAVAPWTERLRYLVAVRPGLQSPSVAARMTATLDRVSNGRLLINVVTGGDPVENKGDGIFLDHDARYAVTREFLGVYSDLLAGRTVNVEGQLMVLMANRYILPAALEYQKRVGQSVAAVKSAGGKSVEGKKTLDILTKLTDDFKRRADKLQRALDHEGHGSAEKHARHFRDVVIPAMTALRESGDSLELMIPHELWPLATYREMLFIK